MRIEGEREKEKKEKRRSFLLYFPTVWSGETPIKMIEEEEQSCFANLDRVLIKAERLLNRFGSIKDQLVSGCHIYT